jgi:hypothetical protein
VSEDGFQNPLRGDKFECDQYEGALLLFYPTEHFSAIPTKFDRPGQPPTQAVDTHIVALDRPDLTGKPTLLRDARIFGRALVPQLKGAVGGKAVLGRLARGQAQGGNNAPWILKDPTEQDAALARQWQASNPDPRQPVAAPEQWQGPPTSPVSQPTATPSAWDVGSPQPVAPPVSPPAPAAPAAPARDPGLVAFLKDKGVDVDKLPPTADLALIAANLG